MSDKRNILEVLKFELSFLEDGGYGRSVRTPWKLTSTFQDSPACINFNRLDPPRECSECLLTNFVPPSAEGEEIPCHHIPLNCHGETVHSMERQRTQPEMAEVLRDWLRATISRIETERKAESLGKAS